jgi:hypothetical protein
MYLVLYRSYATGMLLFEPLVHWFQWYHLGERITRMNYYSITNSVIGCLSLVGCYFVIFGGYCLIIYYCLLWLVVALIIVHLTIYEKG